MTKTTTIQNRVESALLSGQALTSSAIKNRFGAGNPQAVIQALRADLSRDQGQLARNIFVKTRRRVEEQKLRKWRAA